MVSTSSSVLIHGLKEHGTVEMLPSIDSGSVAARMSMSCSV